LRIELLMSVLAGIAGGLCGTLWSGLVSQPLLAHWPALRPDVWQPESAQRLLIGATTYALGGAAAGLLFWLSWGLVAVVAAPWWRIGAGYGALVCVAGAMPTLAGLALRMGRGRAALAVMAVEALVACVAAGVLCAFVWHRGA
jgi:hypothetical protein